MNIGIAVSILLIAVGAGLVWAYPAEAEGLDLSEVGVIVLVVGFLDLINRRRKPRS